MFRFTRTAKTRSNKTRSSYRSLASKVSSVLSKLPSTDPPIHFYRTSSARRHRSIRSWNLAGRILDRRSGCISIQPLRRIDRTDPDVGQRIRTSVRKTRIDFYSSQTAIRSLRREEIPEFLFRRDDEHDILFARRVNTRSRSIYTIRACIASVRRNVHFDATLWPFVTQIGPGATKILHNEASMNIKTGTSSLAIERIPSAAILSVRSYNYTLRRGETGASKYTRGRRGLWTLERLLQLIIINRNVDSNERSILFGKRTNISFEF